MKSTLSIIKICTYIFAGVLLFSACKKETADKDRDRTYAPANSINQPDATVYTVVNAAHQIAYWNFNNNIKEQVADRTPAINKMAYGVDRNGYKASCFKGNGTDVWFSVPSDDKLRSANLTISAWMRPIFDSYQFVVSQTEEGYWATGYGIYLEGSYTRYVTYNMNFGYEDHAIPTGHFPTDRWYHIAYTYKASSGACTIYIDGEFVESFTLSPAGALRYNEEGGTPAEKFYIGYNGSHADWVQAFKGSIDDVRIYDIDLTAAEIKEIYDNEK